MQKVIRHQQLLGVAAETRARRSAETKLNGMTASEGDGHGCAQPNVFLQVFSFLATDRLLSAREIVGIK